MTGAGRLSSGLQPVTANAAPLWLSCTVVRLRDGSPRGEKPAQAGVSANGKWHPQEREHSDAEGGTRDRVQRRDRLRGHPGQGQ